MLHFWRILLQKCSILGYKFGYDFFLQQALLTDPVYAACLPDHNILHDPCGRPTAVGPHLDGSGDVGDVGDAAAAAAAAAAVATAAALCSRASTCPCSLHCCLAGLPQAGSGTRQGAERGWVQGGIKSSHLIPFPMNWTSYKGKKVYFYEDRKRKYNTVWGVR